MTREEYLKLRDCLGEAKAALICAIKLGYLAEGRLMAAEALVPEGYAVVKLPHP